ncbi:hypothetical protein BH09PSE6_BH09PSE6_09750 [soil metagenome]
MRALATAQFGSATLFKTEPELNIKNAGVRAFALGTLLAAAIQPSLAQEPDKTARIRGTVASLSGDQLVVKTHDGKSIPLTLAKDWAVTGIKKAEMSDIKPGDYVGIASLPKSEGGDGALEVLIFPPSMKGTGEGHYDWDLKPNSSMTNGTVGDAVKSVEGSTVTVTYQGKEKKIAIPASTPIVTFAPAVAADVKPGAAVFVSTKVDAAGKMTAGRVVVGNNGVVPPM